MKKISFKKLLAMLLTLAMMFSIMALAPLGASAATQELWVNGENILTKQDYTVVCGSGTAAYDVTTTTLTLTNATIDNNNSGVGINIINIPLINIVVNGTNAIKNDTDKTIVMGIKTADKCNISGTGSLDINTFSNSAMEAGIEAFRGLSVTDTTIYITTTTPFDPDPNKTMHNNGIISGATNDSYCKISNAKITIDNYEFGIKVQSNELNVTNNSFIDISGGHGGINGYGGLKDALIKDSTINISSKGSPAISSEKSLTIDNSKVTALSENEAGIFAPGTLTVTGNSNIDATGKLSGIQSNGDMTITGGTVTATSTTAIGLQSRGTLNITGGKVIATGGNNNAAIGARFLKTNDVNPSAKIILSDRATEKNGGKIAVSDWFDYTNDNGIMQTISWTSFISGNDKLTGDPVSGLPTNALNHVEITVSTPPTPPAPPIYNYYIIEVVNTENGTISPATTSVMEGGNKTYTITPNDGYIIKDVLVDGVSVGAVDTYTFNFISKAHKITATFGKALPPAFNGNDSFAFAKTLKIKKAKVGESVTARVTAGKQTFDKDEVIIVNENMKITVKSTDCTIKLGKFSKTSGTPVIMNFTKPGPAKIIVTIEYDGDTYTKVLTVKVK